MTAAKQTKTEKKYLQFVGGEKGGVGKTEAAKFISHTLSEMGVDFYPVECDRANPDLYLAYKDFGCKATFFSENEKKQNKADTLYELALEKSIVASLPAQVFSPLKSWLDRNNVVEELAKENVSVLMFFVSNGGKMSVDLFIKSLRDLGDIVPHILIKNLRMRENWDRVDERIKKAIQGVKIEYQEINLPIIDYDEQDVIDGDNVDEKVLSFSEALSSDYLGLMQKKRVKKSLDNFRQDFENLGYFNGSK